MCETESEVSVHHVRGERKLKNYIKETLFPMPPASGGAGSSPLLSEMKAWYLGKPIDG
jgi:hypothetical protein